MLSFTCNYVVPIRRGFLFLWCLGWAALFYCGTPWAFHIIILSFYNLCHIAYQIKRNPKLLFSAKLYPGR